MHIVHKVGEPSNKQPELGMKQAVGQGKDDT